MNYGIKSLFTISLISIFFSGCATMLKGSKSNVYFLNAPGDLEVWSEGKQLSVDRMEAKELYSFGDAFSDEVGGTQTTHYAPGVTLSNVKSQEITLKSGSQEAKVTLKPRLSMNWFWLDLFVWGWVVDGYTGAWNELAPVGGKKNRVDVKEHLK